MSIRLTKPGDDSIVYEVRDLGGGQRMVLRVNKLADTTRSVLLDGERAEQLKLELMYIELTNEAEVDSVPLIIALLEEVLVDA